MKKTISLFLALVLLMSVFSLVFADEIGEQYYTVKVEYSDNVGKKEQLNLMVQGYNVYVDAKMLAERFGYTFGENGNCAVIFNKDMSNGLPVSISEFEYNSTRVSHMLFNRMVDTYKAPFASVKNDKGSWIPLEYSLLLLNSGMAISERALLIDMPTKRVVDYFYDIAKNAERYNFDWTKDFGYKNSDITILAGSRHLVNLFNGLLGYDGTSWASLFQQFLVSTSAYDKKYGEDIALLICTESQEELEAAAEKMEFMSSLLNEDGELGELLSNISYMDDFEVGQMYRQCEAALEGFKAGNTTLATYNRSYEALEKALDKQTWFSHTGGYILEVQKGASNTIGEVLDVCDVAVKIAEIVGYVNEFQNQDEFSLTALKRYLDTQDNSTELPNAMKKSMMDYSDALSSNIMGYTVKRFWDNIDQWIADGVTDKVPLFSIIGKQGTGVLLAWNIASNTIPFISDGISAADKFELALYAQVLQGDTFRSYLNKRNSVFSEDASLTAGNVYDAAQLCYIYLKSCMVTRDAAIASLENKKSELGEEIQPLIDVQNEINGEIANILAAFKEANSTNIDGSLGFLPSDNENYLNIYDDSKLVLWITEVKNANENSDSVDLTDYYTEFVKSEGYKADWKKNPYGDEYTVVRYAVIDLDQDGTPELLLSGKMNENKYSCNAIYTINKDTREIKITEDGIFETYCNPTYSKKYHALVFNKFEATHTEDTDDEIETQTFWQFDGTHLNLIGELVNEIKMPMEYIYTSSLSGKVESISAEEWQKLMTEVEAPEWTPLFDVEENHEALPDLTEGYWVGGFYMTHSMFKFNADGTITSYGGVYDPQTGKVTANKPNPNETSNYYQSYEIDGHILKLISDKGEVLANLRYVTKKSNVDSYLFRYEELPEDEHCFCDLDVLKYWGPRHTQTFYMQHVDENDVEFVDK